MVPTHPLLLKVPTSTVRRSDGARSRRDGRTKKESVSPNTVLSHHVITVLIIRSIRCHWEAQPCRTRYFRPSSGARFASTSSETGQGNFNRDYQRVVGRPTGNAADASSTEQKRIQGCETAPMGTLPCFFAFFLQTPSSKRRKTKRCGYDMQSATSSSHKNPFTQSRTRQTKKYNRASGRRRFATH